MTEWATTFVEDGGVWAIFLLMFLETVFPPIPSELIMPLAGFSAAQGKVDFFAALAAGAVGSLLGATLWYGLGSWLGADRIRRWSAVHGRWLTLSPNEVDRSCAWFRSHGGKAVLVGRMVPAVRTLISLPAGILSMPLGVFLIYSAIGTVGWTGLLAGAGYMLGSQYEQTATWLNPITNGVIAILILWYVYRVATFRKSPER